MKSEMIQPMRWFAGNATLLFWVLFAIWNRTNWGNTVLKLGFLAMALWGSYVVCH